jgi:multidrug efflux pump subunit AcrA (membrane-fusion protein)
MGGITMSNNQQNQQNKKLEVDIEAIKAQLKEEARQELQAELEHAKEQAKEELQVEHKAEMEALEKKIAADEAKMEKSLDKEEQSIKAYLKSCKKVNILIPENPMNPNEVVPVVYQGVIYSIPVGQDFEVPQPIYDTWKYSYDMTRAANQKMDKVLKKEISIM